MELVYWCGLWSREKTLMVPIELNKCTGRSTSLLIGEPLRTGFLVRQFVSSSTLTLNQGISMKKTKNKTAYFFCFYWHKALPCYCREAVSFHFITENKLKSFRKKMSVCMTGHYRCHIVRGCTLCTSQRTSVILVCFLL